MRNPEFCLCENKGADQLCSDCEADQRLCFRYTDSTISLLLKSEISSFWRASVTIQVGLCRTWSESPQIGFSRVAAQIAYSISNLLHTETIFKLGRNITLSGVSGQPRYGQTNPYIKGHTSFIEC